MEKNTSDLMDVYPESLETLMKNGNRTPPPRMRVTNEGFTEFPTDLEHVIIHGGDCCWVGGRSKGYRIGRFLRQAPVKWKFVT